MTAGRTTVGVDGCRGGWFAVVANGTSIRGLVVVTIGQLLQQLPKESIIAIDVPIGLPTTGSRKCDLEARRLLGPKRGSSVFPAPVRSVLATREYGEACSIHVATDGRRMSRQAFAILPKIREIDELLRQNEHARSAIREVHPEVSFAMWNDGQPILSSKKRTAGRRVRENLIDTVWPGARSRITEGLPRDRVKRDDVNDAFAALWTAQRIASGTAITVPEQLAVDVLGVPMQIIA